MRTTAAVQDDPRLPVELLLRDLRAAPDGLSGREAARRLAAYGPNELQRRQRRNWFGELVGQLVHPLALLLWLAAGLSLVAGTVARVARIHTAARDLDLETGPSPAEVDPVTARLAASMVLASTAELDSGDPTEVALVRAAADLGSTVDTAARDRERVRQHTTPARGGRRRHEVTAAVQRLRSAARGQAGGVPAGAADRPVGRAGGSSGASRRAGARRAAAGAARAARAAG